MSVVLVTGGTGFIGSHLVERLLDQGRKVRVLALKRHIDSISVENEEILRSKGAEIVYGDLFDIKTLKRITKDVDTVFHLAGISRPMKILSKIYYDTNVSGTKNILETFKDTKLKRFVHVSTVSVLGLSPDGHPLKEDEFQYEDLKYAMSKREGEWIALNYHFKHRVPVVVIRPSLVYGPRCMVRLVMFKFVKQGLFPLFNNGKAKMEFTYVDNVVDAILLAEKKKNIIGEVFNITDGQSYRIKKVLNTIAEELGVKKPSVNIPYWLGKNLGYISEFLSKIFGIYPPFSRTAADWMSKDVNVYDCSKARRVLGYSPKVSLREGVKRSIEWYKDKGVL
ncbi:NAD-dependent epimerase/dehydratase family protein [Patescibacteria group bacterium]